MTLSESTDIGFQDGYCPPLRHRTPVGPEAQPYRVAVQTVGLGLRPGRRASHNFDFARSNPSGKPGGGTET